MTDEQEKPMEVGSISMEESMGAVFDAMQDQGSEAPVSPSGGDTGLPSAEADEAETPGEHSPARGPDGKFIAKDETVEAPVTAAPDESLAPATTDAPVPSTSAPSSWATDKRALFDKSDPALREYIALREKQSMDGVAKLKADYEGRLGTLAPIADVLAPVESRLRMNGVHPARYVQRLVAADEALRQNPMAALAEIGRLYGVNLSHLTQGGEGVPPPIDPNIAATRADVDQIKQVLWQQKQMQETAALNASQAVIERFRADPKNEHFDTLERELLKEVPFLMREMPGSSQEEILKAAYDRAVYSNPTTRAAILQRQAQEGAAQRQQETVRKSNDAKKIAQTNVATKGVIGASPGKSKTYEETMEEVYNRVNGAA